MANYIRPDHIESARVNKYTMQDTAPANERAAIKIARDIVGDIQERDYDREQNLTLSM